MALVELASRDILKHCISQNIDGLHRKSGIHPSKLSELHGNTNLEICMKCGREHMRDYRVRTAQRCHDHKTGRKCDTPGCGGDLKDTIINFGESLNPHILGTAEAVSEQSDLMVCMGSSMRVSPACDLPLNLYQRGQKFVVINLQKTPVNDYAALVIHERVDKVMQLLMEKLEMPIPEFRRSYRLNLTLDDKSLHATGVDSNGACYTIFKSLTFKGLG